MSSTTDIFALEVEARPANPRMLRSRLMKVGFVYDALPHSRSIPAEVGSTDPAYPIKRNQSEEHPYAPPATDDTNWSPGEPQNDPTLPK